MVFCGKIVIIFIFFASEVFFLLFYKYFLFWLNITYFEIFLIFHQFGGILIIFAEKRDFVKFLTFL